MAVKAELHGPSHITCIPWKAFCVAKLLSVVAKKNILPNPSTSNPHIRDRNQYLHKIVVFSLR